ncbi:MAG: DUF58 domain-containing protein, partial [Halobacteriaceae archaeon]
VDVTNVGDRLIPDLRLVDGVPPALAVVDGSPRLGSVLWPDQQVRFQYTVEMIRGEHSFGETTVIARNWSGTAEIEYSTTVDDTIRCIPKLDPVMDSFPLRNQTVEHAGRVTTDVGGSGIEFHSTREYQHGDPLKRINWHRRAKTGEFTTIQFREERAATVALVIDARDDAYVTDDEDVSGVEHSLRAARIIAPALLQQSNNVGVASFGPEWSWLKPGQGRGHRAQLRETLATADGFSPVPSSDRYLPRHTIRRLRQHLPGDSQVIVLSPVADDYIVTSLRRIEAYGHAVTLVSPDVTSDAETPGGTIATLERDERLRMIRQTGIRVVDWDPEEPLQVAIDNAKRRWSR